MSQIQLTPIGVVRSSQTHAVDHGWGKISAEILIDPAFRGGLHGLEQFSHAVIVFFMHAIDFQPHRDLVRRPRGRHDMPELGIFAQRAACRPSRIGITTVRIIAVGETTLRVGGLDAIDGTPVLDIKPHAATFDAPRDADPAPQWFSELMRDYF